MDCLPQLPQAPWLEQNFFTENSKIRLLGKGNMGKVYHMISKKDGLSYAVKVITLEKDKDPKKYQNEAEILKKINHPSIVKIYESEIWESQHYNYVFISSELAQCSLSAYLNDNTKKNITELQFFEIFDQLMDGLSACHNKNIIHFDLKPDNILVFENFQLKISDFGSAKQTFGPGTLPLLTVSFSLTRCFGSPEMIEMSKMSGTFNKLKTAYNWAKMDVYSLALTMLNVLGVEPKLFDEFKSQDNPEGYLSNLKRALKKIIKKNNFQQSWIRLFMKMLSLDPKVRYTIDEVKNELKKMKCTNSAGEMIENLLLEQCTMELVFVIDTTGSMDRYIKGILTSLKHNIIELKKLKADRLIRVGLVLFKDKNPKENAEIFDDMDEEEMEFIKNSMVGQNLKESEAFKKDLRPFNEYIDILDFNTNVQFIEGKLSIVKCFGGNDECEDLTQALNAAATLDWTPGNKMKTLVIITDAPTHGKRYHDGKSLDDYLEDDQKIDNLEEAIRKLCLKEIGIVALQINDKTEKMFGIIEECCVKNKSCFLKACLDEEAKKDMKGLNRWFKDSFLEDVDDVFSEQWEMYFKDKIRENLNWNQQIDWELSFNPTRKTGIAFKKVKSEIILDTLDFYHLSKLKCESDQNDEEINGLITKVDVLKGAQRKIHLLLTKDKEKLVVKTPKLEGQFYKKIKDLETTWRNYLLAQVILKEFNKILEKEEKLQFRFLDLVIIKIKKEGFVKSKFLPCEKFLEGIFIKYNSNNGWKLALDPGSITYENNLLAQCFSHFSFEYSKGKLLICDLQGVGKEFTDPAIHSVEKVFGDTDVGKYGIYKFFKTHECNIFCEQLKLSNTSKIVRDYKQTKKEEKKGEENQKKEPEIAENSDDDVATISRKTIKNLQKKEEKIENCKIFEDFEKKICLKEKFQSNDDESESMGQCDKKIKKNEEEKNESEEEITLEKVMYEKKQDPVLKKKNSDDIESQNEKEKYDHSQKKRKSDDSESESEKKYRKEKSDEEKKYIESDTESDSDL